VSSSVVTAERTTPIEMGLLATMATLSLWAFRSSYGGTHFFIVGFAFIILSAAVVLIAGRLELPAVVVVALLVLVYALAGGVAAIPDRAIGGIIPTTGSVFTALRMAITGWKDLITTAPPVGSTGDLLVIPILSATFAGGVPFLLIDRVGAAGRTRDQQARTFDWAGVAAAVPSMIVLGSPSPRGSTILSVSFCTADCSQPWSWHGLLGVSANASHTSKRMAETTPGFVPCRLQLRLL